MTVSTGDILRVVATYLWTDGNVMQNVFNAVVTGGGGPWDDEDIVDDAAAWVTAMFNNLTTYVSDEVDGSQVIAYKYDAIDDDWDEVASENWVWDPTQVAEQLPRAAGPLLNLRTTDPDVNGKKYLGGWTENSLTDGLWSAGALTGLILFGSDWLTAFVGSISGATWTPGVWSPTGTVFKAASDVIIIPTMPAYQRRRKRGIGI